MSKDNSQPAKAAPGRLGSRNLDPVGLPSDGWRDGYHLLLTMPLSAFFAVMAAAFLLINSAFGLLYLAEPGSVSGARPGNFEDAFFFSVQTLGTLGYGVMSPKGLYGNLVATAETFVGLFNLAVATGLLFARISRPTARIMFSRHAVVTPFDGVPTLMFRAANRRRNIVVEAEVSLTLVFDATSAEGLSLRRFVELPVVRARTPLFFLTWQVMHRIDEASPLFGESPESLSAKKVEILVVMKGVDETFVATIHARTSYLPAEIHWDRKLADIFVGSAEGEPRIDFRRFHQLQ